MKIIPLASPQNSLLKRIRSLHERSARLKTGLFLIEGEKVLDEALIRGIEIEAVVARSDKYDGLSRTLKERIESRLGTIHLAEENLFKALVTTTTPCSVVAAGKMHTTALSEFAGKSELTLIVGENLQDPGNLGTIIRTALAFGADGLILTSGSVDPFNPKVVRSAMGALFALPLAVCQDLKDVFTFLKAEGIETVALNPEAADNFTALQYGRKTAILVGNEGNGLSREADNLADKHATIPLKQKVESLNAAVAAAVVLFHLSQAERAEK